MRNLHQILLQEYGVEAWCLFRDWERLWLRASDYKNHRIFTLRCLHKDLVPVSIKLKSTLKTVKARQIIWKAEKDLLQARVNAINNILDNVTKQTEECRTQLASIISAQRLRECQGFIDKVSEIRFTKVRQRQLNKFNILINKKEGNITRANAINLTNNLASQAGRQASASLPSREGSNPAQTGRQAGTLLPSRERSNQAGSQAGTPQATAHLPLGEGSSSSQAGSQAGALLPSREGSCSSQAIAHLPLGEGSNSSPAGSQAGAILPSREGISSSQAIAHLPPGEGSNSPSAGSQAGTLLPSREGSSASQAIAYLPPSEGSNFPPAIAHLPSGEGSSSPPAGQSSNQARSIRQSLQWSNRHRAPWASQENSTISWEDNFTTTPQ